MPQKSRASPFPRGPASRLDVLDWVVLLSGIAVVLLRQGFHWHVPRALADGVAQAALLTLGVSLLARRFFLLRDGRWWSDHWASIVLTGVWGGGWLVGLGLTWLRGLEGWATSDSAGAWAQLLLLLHFAAQVAVTTRQIAARGWNPALVFVASFGVLILSGTLLLMLPACRVQKPGSQFEVGAPWPVALFTSTSACCVTGLTVVDTGTYWTRSGQTVLLVLFQLGGLGVMTFGAFFAAGIHRGFLLKERALIGNLLETEDAVAVRRLVLSILVFTFLAELVGAGVLMSLSTAPRWQDRWFFGTFHSVSAFCNAGFSLYSNNLIALEQRWQVWGGVTGLIILGGAGFDVLQNTSRVVWSRIRGVRPGVRLSLTSRLVLVTSGFLLLMGTLAFLILEQNRTLAEHDWSRRIANAWFQSVTCRTAGFNTLDIGRLHPSTKLVAIGLMFVGASPGSTGGGVKTVAFALTVLAPLALFARRERIELAARTVPDELVKRAAVIVALGLALVLASTFAIVTFEDRPEQFLDHLFEATSAFATVGLSTGITAQLKLPSQLVLVVTMFAGRVGPLTLLLALAGKEQEAVYRYPEERVLMG